MNRNFSKSLPIAEGFVATFAFSRVRTVNGLEFLVSVIDRNRMIISFSLQQRGTTWKIVEADEIPDWITQVEGELERAILENTINTQQ